MLYQRALQRKIRYHRMMLLLFHSMPKHHQALKSCKLDRFQSLCYSNDSLLLILGFHYTPLLNEKKSKKHRKFFIFLDFGINTILF